MGSPSAAAGGAPHDAIRRDAMADRPPRAGDQRRVRRRLGVVGASAGAGILAGADVADLAQGRRSVPATVMAGLLELATTCQRLSETQRNLPVPLNERERTELRAIAGVLRLLHQVLPSIQILAALANRE